MTTSEKLLVQIFETRSRIIEQVKHQTALYNRHLASKALLHGVTPPSWLFNPNPNPNPNPNTSLELSKEDLISELLPPGPSSRPPVRYSIAGSSQYSKPFITDFGGVSAEFGTEAHASNKDGPDVVEGQSTIVEGRECVDRNTSNSLPELEVSSPVDVVDVRVSNIYSNPDRSLARIQRSKSRQKAIEQRNSATSQATRNSGNEGTRRASSGGNILFSLDYEQTGHISDSNIPAEPCAISNAKESTCHLRDENNIGACSNEIKLKALVPEQIDSVNEPPISAEPFPISSGGCSVNGKSETDYENLREGYNDLAVPVSISERFAEMCDKAEQQESVNKIESIEPGAVKLAETFHVPVDGERREKSLGNSCSPLPNAAVEIPRDSFTTDKAGGSGVQVTESEHRRSWHDGSEARQNDGHHLPSDEAGGSGVQVTESEHRRSWHYGSEARQNDGHHLPSDEVASTPSNHLPSDEAGGSGVQVMESEHRRSWHYGSEARQNDGHHLPSDEAASTPSNHLPSDEAGGSGVQVTESEHRRNWHYGSKARQNDGHHLPSDEAASTPSNPLNTFDDKIFSSEQGCESLLELLVEEGSGGEKSIYEDSQFHRGSGDHGMLPSLDICDKTGQLEFVNKIEATEPRTKLAESFHVSEEGERREKSWGNSCSPFPDAAADVPRDSFTPNKVGDSGVQPTESEPRRSSHYEVEGHQNIGEHSLLDVAASRRRTSVVETFSLSNPLNTIDDVKFSSEQGCESSSEMLLEEGSAREKSTYDDSQFQRASGDHEVLLSLDICDKAEQLESVNKIEAIVPGSAKLAESFPVSGEGERWEKSLGNSCSPFPDALADVPRDAFTPNKVGDSVVQATESEPGGSCHYEFKTHQNNGQHSPANEVASRRSNPLNTTDDVKFSSEQGCEFSLELQMEEEKCHSTSNYENIVNHSQEMSEASFRSSWTEKAAESTLGGLFEGTNPSYTSSVYAANLEDKQISEIKSDDCSLGVEKLSVVGEDGILEQSVQSNHMEELCANDADQSLPELELFLIDSQSENDSLDFPGHTTNFDNLELPRSTIARVSLLEKLCKSASAYTPLSHFSSAFRMEKVPDLFHSLPNGVLEHTDLGSVHSQNKDDELRVSLSTSEDEGGLQGFPLSNSLCCSGAPFGFSAVNGFSSPEGRFWEGGYSSRSNSSGKRLSSNPEFECFTIKEDPCISEGNESADDDSDKHSEHVDSLTVDSHAIDSDKYLEDSDPLAVCAAREPSTETSNKFKSFLCSSHIKKGMGKDSQTPLLVDRGKRMAKDSLNNTYKKLKTSGKPSLRSERLTRIRKPYGSNIVSNVTSFIPLVQQKQAAAKACPAKREIKVKALEAAEAAKRLEEKKENERKLKKEALQKERARTMEQEKAKQIELIRKKKEDEQRRKDADMVLKKRLREEEERKEEKKRARTEEIQRKQREQEEKLRAKKAANNDSKPQQMKKPGEQVKLDNKSRPAATSSSNNHKASTCPKEYSYSADLCDNKQVNCTPPDKAKTSDFIRDNIKEKSYEISPYNCSDDEDDEYDELHTKKFIPAWASKNLVAESLSLMGEIDPSVIFPPESRCSLDEVLLPRTLQKVQSML